MTHYLVAHCRECGKVLWPNTEELNLISRHSIRIFSLYPYVVSIKCHYCYTTTTIEVQPEEVLTDTLNSETMN